MKAIFNRRSHFLRASALLLILFDPGKHATTRALISEVEQQRDVNALPRSPRRFCAK